MKFMYRLIAVLLLISASAFAQGLKPISLPKPQTDGGKPLMQVLKERKSRREFSPEKLPLQVLSNMLWAGFGINRPEEGKRTAPSASNRQVMDIYVATADGLFVYNAKANQLDPVSAEDIRAVTGTQAFVAQAPVNLIYVADCSKMPKETDQSKSDISFAETGFIGQNVFLYCASEGLAIVVRGGIPREAMAKAMKLRPDQKITLAQTVGYPKK